MAIDRADSSIGFRIVVVVKNGRGGHCFDTVSHPEIERERGAAGLRPGIEDDCIRLDLIAIDTGSASATSTERDRKG
jgi:hypothetical protein